MSNNPVDEWWIEDGAPVGRVKFRLTDDQLRSLVDLPDSYHVDQVWVDEVHGSFVTFNHESYNNPLG